MTNLTETVIKWLYIYIYIYISPSRENLFRREELCRVTSFSEKYERLEAK